MRRSDKTLLQTSATIHQEKTGFNQVFVGGKSRKEVMEKVGCSRESIATWIDLYLEGGLSALTALVKSQRRERLSIEQKAEMKIDRQI